VRLTFSSLLRRIVSRFLPMKSYSQVAKAAYPRMNYATARNPTQELRDRRRVESKRDKEEGRGSQDVSQREPGRIDPAVLHDRREDIGDPLNLTWSELPRGDQGENPRQSG